MCFCSFISNFKSIYYLLETLSWVDIGRIDLKLFDVSYTYTENECISV